MFSKMSLFLGVFVVSSFTLGQNSQPCKQLLRYCVWGQEEQDCEKLFRPVITDYGKCCTFNMMPPQLMETNHSITGTESKFAWSAEDLREWGKWDYDNDGYILKPDLKYPYRQRRAGASDGLSLLIDPDTENDFCPSTDSEGLKLLYHLPLEAPRVSDLGPVIGVNREVFLEINPDLTIADPGIETFHHDTRKCYYGLEYKLDFYQPYTRSNCIEECLANILITKCKCILYYFFHNSTTRICSSTQETKDYACVKAIEQKYLGKLHKECPHCKYPCNDLTYSAEITSAALRDAKVLWALANGTKLDWMSHKLTVLHVFMGSDSTVPKLRAKLYQPVDLIANTGGLLGLSIGFSVLSAVEIIYFATIRLCCRHLRKTKKVPEESIHAVSGQDHSEFLQFKWGGWPTFKNTFSHRFSHFDNGNFLHELNNRNLMGMK